MGDPIEAAKEALLKTAFYEKDGEGWQMSNPDEIVNSVLDAYHAAQPSDYAELSEPIKEAARANADAMGYQWDTLYENKQEWIKDRGSRHDINTPMKPDFEDGAQAAIAAYHAAQPRKAQ